MTNTSAEPIRAEWKVSHLLELYPRLLDVLIDMSPAFRHLRNPLARALRTRLVSVAQAARIAGLEPDDLVHTLNAAIGVQSEPSVAQVSAPSQISNDIGVDTPIAEDLDVRPLLANGEEPFSVIMASAARVPAGKAMRLHTSFEPVPLYDVLGGRGFEHETHQFGPDDWETVFRRGDGASSNSSSTAGSPVASPSLTSAEPHVVRLDVSDLAPPEPMVRILEAAAKLGPEQMLCVEHHRRPVYLYPQLDAQGFLHETRELGPGQVEILIRRPRSAALHGAGSEETPS
jgi:uncharacterized protein (DUF2249 family)